MPDKSRVAIYARVSTRPRVHDKQDIENQLLQLRKFVEQKGWTLVGEYAERQSGADSERKYLQQMLADARQRKFDILLVWSLDRFSREGVLGTVKHLELLSNYGVAFVSYTEQYLDMTGPFRDAIIGILAAIAKQERDRHIERVRAGIERRKAKGLPVGGIPVVYDRKFLVDAKQRGLSLRSIATVYKRERGQRISYQTVRKILKEIEERGIEL